MAFDKKAWRHNYFKRIKSDPIEMARRKAYRKKWLKSDNGQKYNRRRVVAKYGITVELYDSMLAEQGGVCKICGRSNGKRYMMVDHDHGTGQVRGLLCTNCNCGIGHFCEDRKRLLTAVDYLNGVL